MLAWQLSGHCDVVSRTQIERVRHGVDVGSACLKSCSDTKKEYTILDTQNIRHNDKFKHMDKIKPIVKHSLDHLVAINMKLNSYLLKRALV